MFVVWLEISVVFSELKKSSAKIAGALQVRSFYMWTEANSFWLVFLFIFLFDIFDVWTKIHLHWKSLDQNLISKVS